MLPEPLDLFHMSLKFAKKGFLKKLSLPSFIYLITQNKSFLNFLIINNLNVGPVRSARSVNNNPVWRNYIASWTNQRHLDSSGFR